MTRRLVQKSNAPAVVKWMVHLIYDYEKGRVDEEQIAQRVSTYLKKFSENDRPYVMRRMGDGVRLLSTALISMNTALKQYKRK